MPANIIRRSDDKITEKYNTLAERLASYQESKDTPKFYEFGKSVSYHDEDSANLPAFTTNMITLSSLNEEAGETLKRKKCKQCGGDGLVGTGQYCDCDLGLAREKDEERGRLDRKIKKDKSKYAELNEEAGKRGKTFCHKCKGTGINNGIDDYCDCKNGLMAKEHDKERRLDREIKRDKKHSLSNTLDQETKKARAVQRRIIAQLPLDDISEFEENMTEPTHFDENEILLSIQAMLSDITAKSNSGMNKISMNIVSGLINSLDIDDSNKLWLNAQVRSGVLNEQIFMRNIKNSLRNGGD